MASNTKLIQTSRKQNTNSTNHNAHQSEDEMERGIVADIVVVNSLSVLKLLAAKDDAPLLRRDSLLCDARKKKKAREQINRMVSEILCACSLAGCLDSNFHSSELKPNIVCKAATHSRQSWP